MKTKMTIIIGAVVLIAGSLISFSPVDRTVKEQKSIVKEVSEPVGGFVSEDKL